MPAPDSIAITPSDSNCHIKFQAVSRVIALQYDVQIVYIYYYSVRILFIQPSVHTFQLVFKVVHY